MVGDMNIHSDKDHEGQVFWNKNFFITAVLMLLNIFFFGKIRITFSGCWCLKEIIYLWDYCLSSGNLLDSVIVPHISLTSFSRLCLGFPLFLFHRQSWLNISALVRYATAFYNIVKFIGQGSFVWILINMRKRLIEANY